MSRTVKVAAGHSHLWHRIHFRLDLAEALRLVDENIAEICDIIDEAADAGCIMVAFPEDTLGLTGWMAGHFDDQKTILVSAVERMLDVVGKKAKGAVPGLIKMLEAPEPRMRQSACPSLGRKH